MMDILTREKQDRPMNEEQLRGFARRDAGIMTINTQHRIKTSLGYLKECYDEWTPSTTLKMRGVAEMLIQAADDIDRCETESYALAKFARKWEDEE